jgi:hypothetical protein
VIVKPINTASAYIAARVVILAPETITNTDALAAINKMPLEKANLWPLCASLLGRNPSLATIFTMLGKAL